MKVRFAAPALADLEAIQSYLSQFNPAAGSRVVHRLAARALALGEMPYEGRETDEPGVRVLLVPRDRYFVFYRIGRDEIQIVHNRHMLRRRLGLEVRTKD